MQTVPRIPQLPLDVKYRIVEYVLERSPPRDWLDIDTLRALSLTSREWCTCSQPHLFTKSYLRTDNISKLLAVVKNRPVIGSWMKVVYLFNLLSLAVKGFAEAIPVLAELAPLLPNVQKLQIELESEFGPYDNNVYEALSGFKTVPHVVLNTPHTDIFEFGKLFSALPQVPEWRLGNATITADSEDLPSSAVPPSLPIKSLAFSQIKLESGELLFKMLQGALATSNTLRSLYLIFNHPYIPDDLNPFLRAVGGSLEEFVLCFSNRLCTWYGHDEDEPTLNEMLSSVDLTSLTSLRSLSISCVEDETTLWDALNRIPSPGHLTTINVFLASLITYPYPDPQEPDSRTRLDQLLSSDRFSSLGTVNVISPQFIDGDEDKWRQEFAKTFPKLNASGRLHMKENLDARFYFGFRTMM
ncbi:hypothetical protein K474DRAFT_1774948 [Panus rudis PR-1116 ss-1]|nr:hypothetical protein K474DRAFT_1774948 [Panus rudis PR-1116 ss-1]